MIKTKKPDYIIKAIFITSENERTQILTKCNYIYHPDFSVISYIEPENTGLENFKTKINIYNNKKIIIRRLNKLDINLNSDLIVEKNIRNECKYKTPFGVILTGITGDFLEINLSQNSGEIYFSYKIDFNNFYSHSNQAKIKIIRL